MNHAAAHAAVDELFVGNPKRARALRAHLDGCLECRAYYDRVAKGFRTLAGKPDEMTAEELQLFALVFPASAPAARWPLAPWAGALALAAAAALVLVVFRAPTDGFTARGGGSGGGGPALRPLCSRGQGAQVVVKDPAREPCSEGDRLAFFATGHGRRFIAVALLDEAGVEWVVSGAEGALGAGDAEVALPRTAQWRPGVRAVALWSGEPIDPQAAEPCVRGNCLREQERLELPLTPGSPK